MKLSSTSVLWGSLAGAILASGATCGGKAVIDPPGGNEAGGGTGGTSTHSTTSTGTGGTTWTTTTTTTSSCHSCSSYAAACSNGACPDPASVCTGAAAASLDALLGCICAECADVCPNVCSGDLTPDGEPCATCQAAALSATCSAEFSDCLQN